MSPNNHMKRTGNDKVYAPQRRARIRGNGCAPFVRRAAACVER